MNAGKPKPNRYVVLLGRPFRDAHDEVAKQELPYAINVALERLGHRPDRRKEAPASLPDERDANPNWRENCRCRPTNCGSSGTSIRLSTRNLH